MSASVSGCRWNAPAKKRRDQWDHLPAFAMIHSEVFLFAKSIFFDIFCI